jgi:hypothetical protein
MPNFCLLNNKLIRPKDIYEQGIDKNSDFVCFTCGSKVSFRQSRNGDKNYTEHFFHPNNVKDTHIACDENTLEKVYKPMSSFHTKFSNYIRDECREIIRKTESKKHIVDGYDKEHDKGIEFQNSLISVEDIQSRDNTTKLDWIFNVEERFICKVEVGDFIVCEIPHTNWEDAVKVVANNVFLFTGKKSWIKLVDRNSYRVEIDGVERNVWLGKSCLFNDVLTSTCLQYIITPEGLNELNSMTQDCEMTKIMNGRCKKSEMLLDTIHRQYLSTAAFQPDETYLLKGYTASCLLDIAKKYNPKKVVYLTFGKLDSNMIKEEIKESTLKDINVYTFDGLLRNLFKEHKGYFPEIQNTLTNEYLERKISWFHEHKHKTNDYIEYFNEFCKSEYDIDLFCILKYNQKKPLLKTMWDKVENGDIVTFDSIRKQAFIEKWLQKVNEMYDVLFVNNIQDFHKLMIEMIFNDITIPIIITGDDSKFSLPTETITVELYIQQN